METGSAHRIHESPRVVSHSAAAERWSGSSRKSVAMLMNGNILQTRVMSGRMQSSLSHQPVYVVSPLSKIPKSRNQRTEIGQASLAAVNEEQNLFFLALNLEVFLPMVETLLLEDEIWIHYARS